MGTHCNIQPIFPFSHLCQDIAAKFSEACQQQVSGGRERLSGVSSILKGFTSTRLLLVSMAGELA